MLAFDPTGFHRRPRCAGDYGGQVRPWLENNGGPPARTVRPGVVFDYAVAGGGNPEGSGQAAGWGGRKCLSPEMPGGFTAEHAESAEDGGGWGKGTANGLPKRGAPRGRRK